MSIGEQESYLGNQDLHLQSLHPQHPAVQQRNMDNLCPSWNKTECFHLHSLRCILGITWKDKISNTKVLQQTGTPSMHNLLMQCHMCWLGHVKCMGNGRIPKDIIYCELITSSQLKGWTQLRFQAVCKCDMKACHINTNNWEEAASDHAVWRSTTKTGTKLTEEIRIEMIQQKRQQQKWVRQNPTPSEFICYNCMKDFHSRIGLFSHGIHCRVYQT